VSFLSKLSIGARLGLSFATVILLMVALVVFAKFSLLSIGDELDFLLKDRYVKVKMANEVMDSLNQQARSTRNLLLMDDAAARDAEVQTIEAARTRITGIYEKLGPILITCQDPAGS
jgi:methyl-accepting chemotaxis protein